MSSSLVQRKSMRAAGASSSESLSGAGHRLPSVSALISWSGATGASSSESLLGAEDRFTLLIGRCHLMVPIWVRSAVRRMMAQGLAGSGGRGCGAAAFWRRGPGGYPDCNFVPGANSMWPPQRRLPNEKNIQLEKAFCKNNMTPAVSKEASSEEAV